MPSTVDEKFSRFICEVGLRKDLAQQLWDANIQTPQELAGRDQSDLKKVIDDQLLVNHIHPVLKKHLFSISMAADPYKKAVKIMKKYAKSMDDSDDEPMVTSSGLSSDGIQSDAGAYVTENNVSARETTTRVRGDMIVNNNSARYDNTGTRLATNGRGFVQSHIGKSKGNGVTERVMITGGNFVQSNIMSSGPVTYNNTNTVISTTMDQSGREDARRRRNTLMDSCLFIGDALVETAHIGWMDRSDYWVDEINLPQADFEEYTTHRRRNDVYRNKTGKSRALILNNVTFRGGLNTSPRLGAEIDCARMEGLFQDLGFTVQRENDKTAEEMLDLLNKFAQSPENMGIDMTVVYIGSHGERDEQGNDKFVGSDGERVAFNTVKEIFNPENAPLLIDLPKIFFLQFCRQEPIRPTAPQVIQPAASFHQTARVVTDPNVESDSTPWGTEKTETRAMDMICAYATLAGNKAYRDTADGSWFVTALIRVFLDHSDKEDLLSMLTKVNNLVSINEGEERSTRAIQISEVVHNLRKKIYFYPKLRA